jgi:hypothetical protein
MSMLLLKEVFKMKCKNCGNDKEFTMMRNFAQWNNKRRLWIENRGDDCIVCDECNGFEIEDEEWDFEDE